jgi:membrane-bound metal-dependent hydrolase YbcI (DUF457 family)
LASPLGHALVGVASAAVVVKATGAADAAASPAFWLAAFVASGLPDLDVGLRMFGLYGPRYHRNLSHSLFVSAGIVAVGWLSTAVVGASIDWRIWLAWSAALVSHPLLDVATSGPATGERGYGIPLFWPVYGRRWTLKHPIFDTMDFDECHSVRDVWEGIRPEVYRLGPPAVGALMLSLLL